MDGYDWFSNGESSKHSFILSPFDPEFGFASIDTHEQHVSDSAGADTLPAGTTTLFALGEDAALNLSNTFHLDAGRRLSVGGSVNYARLRSTWSGLDTVDEQQLLTFSGTAHYYAGSVVLGASLGAAFDNGSYANSSGTANFSGNGFSAGLSAGNIFTLFDSRLPGRPDSPATGADGGYALQLGVLGYLDYTELSIGGFTAPGGLTFGTQRESAWNLGGLARLQAIVPADRWTLMPFAQLGVSQQLGFSHTLDIPAQGGSPADTLNIGTAQTAGRLDLGIDMQANDSGLNLGVSGFIEKGSQHDAAGGQLAVRWSF